MILSNTTTSAAVQGTTVPVPADDNPILGFGVVGTGKNWVGTPGPNAAIQALGTLTTAVNLDWTVASYFTWTSTTSSNETVTFGLTGATSTASYSLGQIIKCRVTASGSTQATITWPSTVSWNGILTGTSGSSQSAPVLVASKFLDVTLICTNAGSSPTFDGTYTTGT